VDASKNMKRSGDEDWTRHAQLLRLLAAAGIQARIEHVTHEGFPAKWKRAESQGQVPGILVTDDSAELVAELERKGRLAPVSWNPKSASSPHFSGRGTFVVIGARYECMGRNAVNEILDTLRRKSPQLRQVALEILTTMGPRAAAEALASVLDDKDQEVRKSAALALMRLGDSAGRKSAAVVLMQLGVQDRSSIRALVVGLKDDVVDVRVCAAIALRRAGPEARVAVPALVEALKDDEVTVRGQAAFALAAIGSPAVPQLIETLKNPSIDARRLSVIALGKIGQEASSARPALTLLLKDADAEIRMSAVEALKKIGPEPSP
jgi:HEAT repeats